MESHNQVQSKRILIHCEFQYGIGHYVRMVALAQALADNGWTIRLITGTSKVPKWTQPPRTRFLAISRLMFSNGNAVSEDAQRRRALEVIRIVKRFRPSWFVTEHFPFGRWKLFPFYSALMTVLGPLRATGKLKVAASVRDIIDWTKRSPDHLRLIGKYAKQNYDLILVHTDPRLTPWNSVLPPYCRHLKNIRCTGYIGEKQSPIRPRDHKLLTWIKRKREAGSLIIFASAGGGRGGYPHLSKVCQAITHFGRGAKCGLLVVCGPRIAQANYIRLTSMFAERTNVRIVREVSALRPFFNASDLSVSHIGYNTGVLILSSRCKSIVVPMPRETTEQSTRARIFCKAGISQIIRAEHLSAELLSSTILRLARAPRPYRRYVALNGAATTVALLESFPGVP